MMAVRKGRRSYLSMKNVKPGAVLFVLMAAAVVINTAEFGRIDDETRHNYRALHDYDTSNLFEIAISRDNSARRWVGPFYYFGAIFPGSDVIVPEGGIKTWFPFEEAMLTFGRAGNIIEKDYDPESILEKMELEPYVVDLDRYVPDSGSARPLLKERLTLVAGSKPESFLAATPGGQPGRYEKMVLVDNGLLEGVAD